MNILWQTLENQRALWIAALVGLSALVFGGLLGAGATYLLREQQSGALAGDHASQHDSHAHQQHHTEEHEAAIVHFPKEKWAAAGIDVQAVQRGTFVETKWVTGKVALNEDRLAHIYSLVEGIVHEVHVHFGQQVRRGDVLAVIDSREVGQAKLGLVENQLSVRFAAVNHEWSGQIYENTQALIKALEQQVSPSEIEQQFRDQPMGEYRRDLVSAYARLHQARADYERLKELTEKGITREADLIKATADYEAARATFLAMLEQIRFTSWQQWLKSQQALEEARLAEQVSRSSLYIMGYHQEEVARMDPLAEGEEVAHYTIMAPFDGTVISKDIVLEERVGPDTKLFDLADLSTIWVQADIYEKDLPLLQGLKRQSLRFRSDAYPDRSFYAEVFYTGDIVDEKTRTVRMMAAADNPGGFLKPGMFVEVELPAQTFSSVLQVPVSSVVEHEGERFVFVHKGGEEFERRDVKLGRQTESAVEILEGLNEGEGVVVIGTFALKTRLLSESIGETHAH